jgi:hypothetical protein
MTGEDHLLDLEGIHHIDDIDGDRRLHCDAQNASTITAPAFVVGWPSGSDKLDGDIDVAAGGFGINASLVCGVDQGLGGFAPDARQADVEANSNEVSPVGIAQVDLSVDGQVGRQGDFYFSCLKLHRADETGRPVGGEKLLRLVPLP